MFVCHAFFYLNKNIFNLLVYYKIWKIWKTGQANNRIKARINVDLCGPNTTGSAYADRQPRQFRALMAQARICICFFVFVSLFSFLFAYSFVNHDHIIWYKLSAAIFFHLLNFWCFSVKPFKMLLLVEPFLYSVAIAFSTKKKKKRIMIFYTFGR